jgi:hypothetical protein
VPEAATASVTVQPTCSIATGTIVVSAPTGSDYEYNIDGGAYQASVTFANVAAGSHNILVRRTSDNTCISSVTSITVNSNNATPSAPIVGTITQPSCSVSTGNVVLSGLPSGNWTINPGSITGSATSKTISGLATGTYNFTVTNASGCTSDASANVVINAQPETPPTPVITRDVMILHSDALTGNQWYNQTGIINGAIQQYYTSTSNGDYYVIVTLVCSSSASNIISILNTGIVFGENNKSIKVYPNPVSKELIIELEGNKEILNFEILNSLGQPVYKGMLYDKTKVKTDKFKPGFYYLKLTKGDSSEIIKIIKE